MSDATFVIFMFLFVVGKIVKKVVMYDNGV